jgi:hypothetical protein
MIVLANIVPGPVVDADVVAANLVDAISSQNWGVVIGCVIMLIVWGVRLVWTKLPSKWLPWLAVAIGSLGAIGASLMLGTSDLIGALLAGIQAGLAAAGTWGLLGVIRK